MLRNPLARHVAWFLVIKAALIGLGIWWFMGSMPEPRGALPPVGVTQTQAQAPR